MHSDSLDYVTHHKHYGVENLLASPPLERGTPDTREGDRVVGNGYGHAVRDWEEIQ